MRRPALLAAVVGLSSPLAAQTSGSISGTVVGPNGQPLPYSTATIVETRASRFTNDAGEFIISRLSPGSYHLRVKQLGFVALDTLVAVSPGANQRMRIILQPTPFKLATVTVNASRRCLRMDEAAASGGNFETILNELRSNAERQLLLVKSYPFLYRLARSRQVPAGRNVFTMRDTTSLRSDERPRYTPGEIVQPDPDSRAGNHLQMVIPVLEDIGDPEFLRSHCFTYEGIKREDGVQMYRIDFDPVSSVRRPDVAGSAFIDTKSFVVRRAVFHLTRSNQVNPSLDDLTVTTNYREILPGVTVIGDVTAVQILQNSFARTTRLTEKQSLLDYQFLGTKPGAPPQ